VDHGELIRAAQQGDRSAFDELVRQTYVDTFTLACRLTGNEEDARDVAQDAYLRAWRGIGRFRGEAQFSTWMYRITANAASTQTQRRRRLRTDPLEDHMHPVEQRFESLPGPAAESAEALDRLSDAIATLPVKLRHVVILKDVYGLSHEEIAAELDVSVAAAKVRLHRARRKLKDMLYEPGEEAHAV
jgi:RNA polymerase sigma-70 factor (ECF subfamily)